MSSPVDVLLFVEDPGAANYILALPGALRASGSSCLVVAAGSARAYLRERGVELEEVPPGEDAAALLGRWSPRLLAVGTSENPQTLGLALVERARSLGIPSLGFVDALSNAEYRFRGPSAAPLAYAPDWVAVPDRATAAAFEALGLDPDRVRVCGHPHWDEVRQAARAFAREDRSAIRSRLLPGCPVDRPAVVFVAEISTGFQPEQYRRSPAYTLQGRGRSDGRTEIVLEEFLDAAAHLRPEPFLVLRLHPKNRREEFTDYLPSFDQVSAGGNPLELLHAADLTVGMTSMLLHEAALMDVPTLSILPREVEQAWLPTIAQGATPCALRREEVGHWLGRLLSGYRPAAPAGGFFGEGGSDSLTSVRRLVEERLGSGRARGPA